MRVLIEVLHIAIGLAAALCIGWLAKWAYPRAAQEIWLVVYVSMAAVVVMGIGPLRRAYAIDRKRLARNRNTPSNG